MTTKDHTNQSLAAFARTLDGRARRPIGFDVSVRHLYVVRAQLAQLKAARNDVYQHVTRAYQGGHRELRGSDGLVYRITMTEPKIAAPTRAAGSDVVRKANKDAWQAAVIRKPFVRVVAPIGEKQRVPVLPVPDGKARFISPPEAVVIYKTHPAWLSIRGLNSVRNKTAEALRSIADELGWDGGVEYGPLVFTDGWEVQLARGEYSSEELARVAPEVFDQLAVTTYRQVKPRIVVKCLDGGEDYEGDDDEIYGE